MVMGLLAGRRRRYLEPGLGQALELDLEPEPVSLELLLVLVEFVLVASLYVPV